MRKRNVSKNTTELRVRWYFGLFMVKFFGLVFGLTGQINSQLPEDGIIYLRQDNRGMCLASTELGKLTHRKLCRGIGCGTYR